ncbi:MAG: preprotein translocase subunit SecE [Proteobacteria bacterium]|nr:preprotein translocase subunit SecE [Pseudomonadota bacterium]
MRHQRFIVLSFIATGVLVAVAFQAGLVSGFGQFAVPDTRVLGLVNLSSVLSLVAGVLTFVALLRNEQAVQFTDEVVDELTKVTWPTRDETVRASTTVVVTTLFTAGVLGGYDFIWKKVADMVLFTAG